MMKITFEFSFENFTTRYFFDSNRKKLKLKIFVKNKKLNVRTEKKSASATKLFANFSLIFMSSFGIGSMIFL